jgi:Fe-S cluster biogenesis protein NfuA
MDRDIWKSRMEEVVRTTVRPLEADGGRFVIAACDPETKTITVEVQMGDCEECVMEVADLERLLQEVVVRTDAAARVSVLDAG